MLRPLAAASLALLLAVPAIAASHTESDKALNAAIAGPQRSAENKARDAYRHPAQTLEFFGVKPTMAVVEVLPSGGWYTEILAPYLRDNGKLYAAAVNPAQSEGAAKNVARFKEKLAASPALYDKVVVTSFGVDPAAPIAPGGSADAVLTFRNVHNMYMNKVGEAGFKAMYAALKPGGTLGVVDHRLPEDRPDAEQMTSGYIKTSTVIKLAEAAGFKLIGQSEINANPNDKANYPKGVWTLPPNYAEKDVDRAKYAAIGESDRMTLKFVKPK